MSTRDVPGGKGGRCVRLTTYHHIMPMSRNLRALTLLDPSGPAWPVMGVLYLYKDTVYVGERRRQKHTGYVNTVLYTDILVLYLMIVTEWRLCFACTDDGDGQNWHNSNW
jgi:hypothetical protein